MPYPIPDIGLRVKVSTQNIVFKNSNVPAIRIIKTDEGWVPVPNSVEQGLIVYIQEPAVLVLDKVQLIEITGISHNRRSAFAKDIPEPRIPHSGDPPGRSSAQSSCCALP
jgi:hypothetical protein